MKKILISFLVQKEIGQNIFKVLRGNAVFENIKVPISNEWEE